MTEGIRSEVAKMMNTPETLDESSVDKSATPVSVPPEDVPNTADMSEANGDALTLTKCYNPSKDGSTIHDVAETTVLEEDDLGWPIALWKGVRNC